MNILTYFRVIYDNSDARLPFVRCPLFVTIKAVEYLIITNN